MRRLIVALLLMTAVAAFAQTEAARIAGRVTDLSGAVIVGAECKITNIETNVSTIATTNGDGIYVIPDLHPAIYRLTIQKEGFRTVVQPSLQLYVQDAVNENFTLAIGPASESVTIMGTPLLQTDSASVSNLCLLRLRPAMLVRDLKGSRGSIDSSLQTGSFASFRGSTARIALACPHGTAGRIVQWLFIHLVALMATGGGSLCLKGTPSAACD
jgi:hypothetical protein